MAHRSPSFINGDLALASCLLDFADVCCFPASTASFLLAILRAVLVDSRTSGQTNVVPCFCHSLLRVFCSYYAIVRSKFWAFGLTEYKRVQFMDCDQVCAC